jgi:hypothetical protein
MDGFLKRSAPPVDPVVIVLPPPKRLKPSAKQAAFRAQEFKSLMCSSGAKLYLLKL